MLAVEREPEHGPAVGAWKVIPIALCTPAVSRAGTSATVTSPASPFSASGSIRNRSTDSGLLKLYSGIVTILV